MIVITGGTGFIGSHLLNRLESSGERVRALTRRSGAERPGAGTVEWVQADFTSRGGLERALEGAHTVIHLAGVTKALRAADYYSGNVRATEALAHAVAGRDIRFVHVSSLAAIGPSPDGVPVGEDAEPRPISHYGKSKLMAERVVRSLLPDSVIVRPPVVYGPRDTDVFQLLKSISKGLVLEIAGGERWLSAIYVEDLVEGILAAAHSARAPGRAYFLTHAKASTWSDLTGAAARIMHRRPRVLRVPVAVAQGVGYCAELWSRITGTPGIISRDKVAEALCMSWTCDHRRAAAELGFVASTPLEEGLAKSLAWYKEAGWLAY
jgi:nucleoside-diphosphate-sugar epimerase